MSVSELGKGKASAGRRDRCKARAVRCGLDRRERGLPCDATYFPRILLSSCQISGDSHGDYLLVMSRGKS